MAMQMRFLQTLADVGSENNTTIVFPLPIDLSAAFGQMVQSNGRQPPPKPANEPLSSVGR